MRCHRTRGHAIEINPIKKSNLIRRRAALHMRDKCARQIHAACAADRTPVPAPDIDLFRLDYFLLLDVVKNFISVSVITGLKLIYMRKKEKTRRHDCLSTLQSNLSVSCIYLFGISLISMHACK